MLRLTHPIRLTCPCRPRTRGDAPRRPVRHPGRDQSAPHARGCSTGHAGGPPAAHVGPARAGMLLLGAGHGLRLARRPRTRGDAPSTVMAASVARGSAPHARGCSLLRLVRRTRPHVGPARAEMLPGRWPTPSALWRRPRTRGNAPVTQDALDFAALSAPHARGCSVERPVLEAEGAVGPARAGMLLPLPSLAAGRRCRPCTRGDAPAAPLISVFGRESAPHARGCSGRRHDVDGAADVGPARAGMLRTGSRPRSSVSSRPRTRGNAPSSPGALPPDLSSAPHARGCSARWDNKVGQVGSALHMYARKGSC